MLLIWPSPKISHLVKGLTHYNTMPHFDALKIHSCKKKHCEKSEIACNKQFILFLQCFLLYLALIFPFKWGLKCLLQCLNLDQSKILSSGKELHKFDFRDP